MITFDHAVLNVRSLQAAMHRYENSGFQVLPGGRHAGGMTHNALIPLANASYLELLAPARLGLGLLLRSARRFGLLERLLATKPPFARYFSRHLAGAEGLVDYALHRPDLEGALQRAREAGLSFDGPFPGARTKPDGQRIAWKLALPSQGGIPGIPFLIQDDTPRELRAPAASDHPNGAQGVRRFVVRQPQSQRWARGMSALLDRAPSNDGESAITFDLGTTLLMARSVEAPSPFSLELATSAPADRLSTLAAYGAEIELG